MKSDETAKLRILCRLEVRQRALAREFCGTRILRFAQRNRQLNISGGRLLPLAGVRETAPARPLRPLSVRLVTTGGAIPSSTENLLLPLRDVRPTADGRRSLTYNSSAVKRNRLHRYSNRRRIRHVLGNYTKLLPREESYDRKWRHAQ